MNLEIKSHLRKEDLLKKREFTFKLDDMVGQMDFVGGKIEEEEQRTEFFGQRKLLLSEIWFLAKYSKDNDIILYIGAAPGHHTLYLSKLFPKLNFHLYDPTLQDTKFSKELLKHASKRINKTDSESPDGKIKIFNRYYEKEDYENYAGSLLVSDIRNVAEIFGKKSEFKKMSIKNLTVHKDMMLQMEMIQKTKPRVSYVKFKLPFSFKEQKFFTEYDYLEGDVIFQCWSKSSNETRLVIEDYKKIKPYNPHEYERKMNYFQKIFRSSFFEHSGRKGYCHCYDCTFEVKTLDFYEKKYNRKISIDDIDDNTGPETKEGKAKKNLFFYETIRQDLFNQQPLYDFTYVIKATGENILHLIVKRNDFEFLERMLYSSNTEMLNQKSKKGYTPAELSLSLGHFRCTKLFGVTRKYSMKDKKTGKLIQKTEVIKALTFNAFRSTPDTFEYNFNQNIPSNSLIPYLLMTKSSKNFITRPHYWKKMIPIMKPYFGLTITDAFSSVGGDTINFSPVFKKVNSFEIDYDVFTYLLNNVNVYDLKNVKAAFGSYIDNIDNIIQDVIYFDPPWGDVKEKKKTLYLRSMKDKNISYSIDELVEYALSKNICKVVFVKLPPYYKLNVSNSLIVEKYELKSFSGKYSNDEGGIQFLKVTNKYPYIMDAEDFHKDNFHLRERKTKDEEKFTRRLIISDEILVFDKRSVRVDEKAGESLIIKEFLKGKKFDKILSNEENLETLSENYEVIKNFKGNEENSVLIDFKTTTFDKLGSLRSIFKINVFKDTELPKGTLIMPIFSDPKSSSCYLVVEGSNPGKMKIKASDFKLGMSHFQNFRRTCYYEFEKGVKNLTTCHCYDCHIESVILN